MRLFGLIGYPLSHSFSRQYFTEKFRREGITDAAYEAFPLDDVNRVHELLKDHPQLRGFNVTVPYKQQIIPLLDALDETAQVVGAVNTVVCSPAAGGRFHLKGCNTDVHGFRQSLKPFLASHHERALILGTGGAAKAVEHVLRTIGIDCIFVSRDGKTLDGKTVLTYAELNPYVMDAHKLIVNCTPVGTFPAVNEAPAIPYEAVTAAHFLYDLVYNPAETEFIRRGKANGALTLNGMDMLKMQAEAAWQIWNP